jgi:NADH-quinone oxidoreductase subunit N
VSTTATLVLTYGVTLVVSVFALGLDAFGRRSAGLVVAAAGLCLSAVAGLAAGILDTQAVTVGPIGVGGPASMVYGVIALVGAAALVGGFDSLRVRPSGASTAALVGFAVAAGGGTAAALDLTTVLLLIETLALASYALVAGARTARAGESALKYFVQGAVATGLFLFGMAVLVGLFDPSGQYAGLDLAGALTSEALRMPALVGSGLVMSAFLFKMGAFPFHSWAPDAYETAPVESAAFLAAGPKLAAIAAASIFVTVVSAGSSSPEPLILVAGVAVLSILVGSVAALRQRDYRRLLAYAGIAQAGYALIAIALPMAPLAVFFGSTYALAATGTFLAAAAFARIRPDWDGSVAGLAGLGRRAPLLSGAVAILLISLAGIPPFLGFWAKLIVFATALTAALGAAQSGSVYPWVLGGAVAVGILGSVISLGYYGAILRSLYFDSYDGAADGEREVGGSGGSATFVVVALALVVVVLSVLPLVLGPTAVFDFFIAS